MNVRPFASSFLIAATLASALSAQSAKPTDPDKAVKQAGAMPDGWTGATDSPTAKLADANFVTMGKGFHVTSGPAAVYWNPANVAKGDYTVMATFNEEKYMNLNDHPHPYGIVIGGNDLGSDNQSYLYCAAYGSGTFIVRGMGPAPFQMNGRGEANAAVHKAAGPGQPVTQTIAVSVKGDKVSCTINGTEVASYDKSALIAAGKLKSTDGVYGIRFAHNTEATVTNFMVMK